MEQQKYFTGVSVVVGLVAGIALVLTIALLVQALYLRQAELSRVGKIDLAGNAVFTRLESTQRDGLAGDYSVIEKNDAGEPTRIHIPIDVAMGQVLESARASAK